MFKQLLTILAACSIYHVSYSQSWSLLPNSPTAAFRHDDLYFMNEDIGWVVNVDGYIYKTTDGGNSFDTILYQPETSFRCVGFANALKGWAGNLGTGSWSPTTDTLPLYETSDGGLTWQAVTSIEGTLPKGICGIDVVNDNVIYAVGRVGGPSFIMKTIDGGASWSSVNFDPPAYYLIDCKFFSPDTGFVAGCTGSSFSDEKIAVWRTTDGGENWIEAYHDTSSYFGHCWKIDFPSRNIGYVSIESGCFCDTSYVLKTTDGGLTWEKKIWDTTFNTFPIYEQGIGFMNDSLGWCGSAAEQVKETSNGGHTWNVVPFAENFNRFRKVNDTIAYASGNRIWKYNKEATAIHQPASLSGVLLDQNYPNPFTEHTSIKYHLPASGHVIVRVWDFAGRPVKTLVNDVQVKGEYEIELQLPYYYDTYFYYTLSFENTYLTRKAFMIGDK